MSLEHLTAQHGAVPGGQPDLQGEVMSSWEGMRGGGQGEGATHSVPQFLSLWKQQL